MKGLLLKVLLFSALMIGIHAGEMVQITFHLLTNSQEDRDLFLIQKFLIAQVERERELFGYRMVLNDKEEIEIKGDRDKMKPFFTAFEDWIKTPLTEEVFEDSKKDYLNHLALMGEFDEQALLEEMDFEAAVEGKNTLLFLSAMIESIADFVEKAPQVELVSHQPNYQLFYNLPISEAQQHAISKLIKKMGDSGYWTLLKSHTEMEALGNQVVSVHPLRFIGHIYGNPSLKKRMPKILDDIFKRRGFLNGYGKQEGFAQRMTREANHKNLMQYLPGFAQSIGVTQSSIEPYFHRHDWEGLLRYLAK